MKVSVFGVVAIAVTILVLARAIFEYLAKLLAEPAAAPIAATPPPMARRSRRARGAAAPAAAEPEVPAPAPAAHLDASSLVVTRPARAHARSQFRGPVALRQAIVAREVLGPPLALRPPRF